LLLLQIEVAARGLELQLETLDGFALLAEGQLLAGVADAERERLVLNLGECGVPLLQRLLCRLASNALPLQRRSGIAKGSLLLLEPLLSPLAGDALLLELLLSGDEGRGLGVEGCSQVISLLGALLQPPRPLLSLALLRLRTLERRAELPGLGASGGHLRLPGGGQRPRLVQVLTRVPQRLVAIDEGRADPLEARVTRCALP
jgi:hypothetical protein